MPRKIMKSKKLTFWTVAALISIVPTAQSAESTAQAAPNAKPVILYTAIAWGNAVDYGSFLVPIQVYESLTACEAVRKKRPEEVRCSEAKTSDEKLVAQMLANSGQNK
jgi:hypothetical protein